MEYILIITSFVLVAIGAAWAIAYSLRKQRDAAIREMETIAQRLTNIEKKLEDEKTRRQEEEKKRRLEDENEGNQEDKNTGRQGDKKTKIQEDLSGMTDEELFQYITKVVREQELYRWSDFNRSAVMKHFSLSAARVGAVFAQGGGQSLPEFVRNCRLDHACRLIVERPSMSFVEVGESSGYQRTTTFYHDFKARFGMTPAEYRKEKLKNE
ncbi:MAG: AraC family transcriptional regulator [Bacteroidaceae bacterium]|nr:AraC family transcriptional regulator [Bacteroidaceae bacterium]